MYPLKWRILYTKPQFERTVHQGLARKGLTAYLPEKTELRQWSDRKKKVKVPLFPGYVFVRVNDRELDKALWVQGVVRFVCFANEIATIRDEEIRRIELLLSSNLDMEVMDDVYELHEGDEVCLDSGPLAGQTVKFIEYKGKKRGLFHLEAIGKLLIVNLPLHQAAAKAMKYGQLTKG